jgi:hypothetical protein
MLIIFEIKIDVRLIDRSTIRINSGREFVKVDTPQILHCTQARYFWINWRYGSIEVGRGQLIGWDKFMVYQPLELYDVQAIGYSTGYGFNGTWVVNADVGQLVYA